MAALIFQTWGRNQTSQASFQGIIIIVIIMDMSKASIRRLKELNNSKQQETFTPKSRLLSS